jgi:hypothetical protein
MDLFSAKIVNLTVSCCCLHELLYSSMNSFWVSTARLVNSELILAHSIELQLPSQEAHVRLLEQKLLL